MMSIDQQIEQGLLVCPRSKTRLRKNGATLTSDAGSTYSVTGSGVPLLIVDSEAAEKYVGSSAQMVDEYQDTGLRWLLSRVKEHCATTTGRRLRGAHLIAS